MEVRPFNSAAKKLNADIALSALRLCCQRIGAMRAVYPGRRARGGSSMSQFARLGTDPIPDNNWKCNLHESARDGGGILHTDGLGANP